jgi:heme/copper-type cytochrome/quinol oxidase subunit 2
MRGTAVRPSRRRLVGLALAAALAACSSGGTDQGRSPAATGAGAGGPRTIQVQVTGNQVQTAERRVKVPLGTQVRLEVTADRADEVHLHGYDRKVDIEPGRMAVLEVTADTPGVFEVELEEAGLKLVELQVS